MTAIVLDTETTGLSKETDRVIEIGVVAYESGAEILLHRVNPGRSIPPEVTAIHGISDDDVRECPYFTEYAHQIKTIIEGSDAVIGYHVVYDQGMLDAEFARCGLSVRWPPLVCAKRIWDVYEPKEERHLQNAYRRFVDKKGFENAHSALADVHATRDVLYAQIQNFGLSGVAWEAMDPERRFWWGPSPHIILADSGDILVNFGKNKGKSVADVDVGFWRWVTDKDFPDHVLLLALQMIEQQRLPEQERRQAILSWAIKYKSEKGL